MAAGDTETEVEQEIRAAIALHLEGLLEEGLAVPVHSSRVEYMEVTAISRTVVILETRPIDAADSTNAKA
jgi:hypothetical protein